MKRLIIIFIAILLTIVGCSKSPDKNKEEGMESEPVNTSVKENLPRDIINVKDFGAVGDGKADDTESIKKAINAGGFIFFPEGEYLVSEPLTVESKKIHGAGMENTTIKSNADAPIFSITKAQNDIRDLRLQYEGWDQQKFENRNAIQFEGQVAHSSFENLNLISVYRGFYIKETEQAAPVAFSINLKNIYVFNYAKNALHFVPPYGGLSGSVIENIYTHNGLRDKRYDVEVIPFVFSNTGELTLIQLNAEWSNIETAFDFTNARNAVLISPHIEGTDMYGDDKAFFEMKNSNVKIMGARILNNNIHSKASLYKLAVNSNVSIDGVHLENAKKSGDGSLKLYDAEKSSSNYLDIARFYSKDKDFIQNLGTTNDDGTPVLTRLNDKFYFDGLGVLKQKDLPDPSEDWRGKMVLIETSSGDKIYVCVLTKDDSYEWVEI